MKRFLVAATAFHTSGYAAALRPRPREVSFAHCLAGAGLAVAAWLVLGATSAFAADHVLGPQQMATPTGNIARNNTDTDKSCGAGCEDGDASPVSLDAKGNRHSSGGDEPAEVDGSRKTARPTNDSASGNTCMASTGKCKNSDADEAGQGVQVSRQSSGGEDPSDEDSDEQTAKPANHFAKGSQQTANPMNNFASGNANNSCQGSLNRCKGGETNQAGNGFRQSSGGEGPGSDGDGIQHDSAVAEPDADNEPEADTVSRSKQDRSEDRRDLTAASRNGNCDLRAGEKTANRRTGMKSSDRDGDRSTETSSDGCDLGDVDEDADADQATGHDDGPVVTNEGCDESGCVSLTVISLDEDDSALLASSGCGGTDCISLVVIKAEEINSPVAVYSGCGGDGCLSLVVIRAGDSNFSLIVNSGCGGDQCLNLIALIANGSTIVSTLNGGCGGGGCTNLIFVGATASRITGAVNGGCGGNGCRDLIAISATLSHFSGALNGGCGGNGCLNLITLSGDPANFVVLVHGGCGGAGCMNIIPRPPSVPSKLGAGRSRPAGTGGQGLGGRSLRDFAGAPIGDLQPASRSVDNQVQANVPANPAQQERQGSTPRPGDENREIDRRKAGQTLPDLLLILTVVSIAAIAVLLTVSSEIKRALSAIREKRSGR